MEGCFKPFAASDPWIQVLVQTGLYGYVLFVAANMIGDGAELLLLVPSYASLVGSVVIPVLGAVPDGMMVLCSGLGDDAQEKLKVGIGALAGSTIMLLTLPWFLAVIGGRVTIKDGKPQYKRPANAPAGWEKLNPSDKWNPLHTGVGLGDELRKGAMTMLYTATSYLIIQLPAFWVDRPKGYSQTPKQEQISTENPFAIAGFVVTILWFVHYMYIQIKESSKLDGKIEAKVVETTVAGIQQGHITLRGAMVEFRDAAWETLCKKGSLEEPLWANPQVENHLKHMCKVLEPFYAIYDTNSDHKINLEEFRMILKDLHENISKEKQEQIFNQADIDGNGSISFEEFVACIIAFAINPQEDLKDEVKGAKRAVAVEPSEEAVDLEEQEEEEEEVPEDLADLDPDEQQKRIKSRAFYKMFLGTALVLIFSDPMCDMLSVIGNKSGVDNFYVSFVLAPLASNASELLAAMKLAEKKTMKSMVNSLCSLEGAAIMNNTFCLGIFLMIIVFKDMSGKGLYWAFSAETMSILIIEVMVAAMVMLKPVQTLLDGLMIFMFYPAALVIVMLLEGIGFD